MVEIRKVECPQNKYSIKCPFEMTPTRIVIHNTYNDAPAKNEISYMHRNGNTTSFHFAVDDKEIVQGIDLNRNAYHAGDGRNGKGNREGIAIEICYSLSGGERFEKAERNAAELTAKLLKDYGWGIDKVTKHQDYDGKYCPHRTLDRGWDRFLNLVKGFMGETAAKKEEAATTAVTKGCKVKVNKGAKSYEGVGVASFVYDNVYTVDELKGDRAVLDTKGICTAFNVKDLTIYGASAAPAAPAAKPTTTKPATTTKKVTKGCKVKVKKGAKDYNGTSVASFVFNNVYTVDQLKGDRAVLDAKGICTAFKTSDLIVQ